MNAFVIQLRNLNKCTYTIFFISVNFVVSSINSTFCSKTIHFILDYLKLLTNLKFRISKTICQLIRVLAIIQLPNLTYNEVKD